MKLTYTVDYSKPEPGHEPQAENIESIRAAKQLASYLSVSAPPRHTRVTSSAGHVIAVYFDGRLQKKPPAMTGRTGIPIGWTTNNALRGDEGPGHFPEDL